MEHLKICIALTFTFFIVACKPTQESLPSPFCNLQSTSPECTYLLNNTAVTLHASNVNMPEEQELVLQIKGEKLGGVTHAYLEGINMYMGKIPVMFNRADEKTLEARIRLGACGEPQMQWALDIEFEDPETSNLQVEFSAQPRNE